MRAAFISMQVDGVLVEDARKIASGLPTWAAFAVMCSWLDSQPDGVDWIQAARAAGFSFEDELIPEIRASIAKGWRQVSEILRTKGADWSMPTASDSDVPPAGL